MTTGRIDVLAVLDGAIEEYTSPRFTDRHGTGPELTKARAAVAELIESANAHLSKVGCGTALGCHSCNRLRAALSKAGAA